MRTSYSALDTYKTCPLKYKYQNIDKIRAPKGKEAVFGTAVHEALKFMFQRNPLFPSLDEVVNFFTGSWRGKSEKLEWDDAREKSAYYDEGVSVLKNFYAKNQPWNFDVVDMESRFEMPLTDAQGENHVLAGIMDRIDKLPDDTYEIIDYKTAKRMPSQVALDSDLQMSIYHMGLLRRWPHLKSRGIKLSLYFLKHGEKISTFRDEESLARTSEAILETIREIEKREATNDFPPTPGPLCDWCGYREMCPMWRHLYKKDAPTEEEIAKIANEYLALKKDSESINARAKMLQGRIHEYLNQNGLERVFGDGGYITRSTKKQAVYDLDRVRPVLEAAGKWAEVLKVDERKLDKIITSLTADLHDKLEGAIKQIKEVKTLTVSRRNMEDEEDDTTEQN